LAVRQSNPSSPKGKTTQRQNVEAVFEEATHRHRNCRQSPADFVIGEVFGLRKSA
jgi:hypothetical protein